MIAVLVIAIIRQMIVDWRATDPNDRDEFGEIVALGAGSLVKAWMRIVGVVAGTISATSWLAEALQLPQVSEAINKYLPAQYVTLAILVIAILGVWARNRTSDTTSVL